jgi:hypothetical protein
MEELPWILLLDDGELDDVRELLEELGIDFEQWHKSDLVTSPPHPQHLLVTTAAHGISAGLRRTTTRTRDRATWIAVGSGDSRTQHRAIIGAGFDYLVKRPTHPETFRSLLRGILYSGNEQRSRRRIAVSSAISFRVDGKGPPVAALLMDLSPGGCRLLTRSSLRLGSELALSFPAELTGTQAFSHRGTVMRTSPGSTVGAGGKECCLGVRFLPFETNSTKPMLDLLNSLNSGPAAMPEAWAAAASAPAQPSRAPRGVYDNEVAIFGLDGCVLNGRDLSSGGLRVDPNPALKVGASLRLALGDADDAKQILVDARVIRDDGENGVALHFDWIDPMSGESLRELVEGLPSTETPTAKPKQRSSILKILRRRER